MSKAGEEVGKNIVTLIDSLEQDLSMVVDHMHSLFTLPLCSASRSFAIARKWLVLTPSRAHQILNQRFWAIITHGRQGGMGYASPLASKNLSFPLEARAKNKGLSEIVPGPRCSIGRLFLY